MKNQDSKTLTSPTLSLERLECKREREREKEDEGESLFKLESFPIGFNEQTNQKILN